MAGTKSNAAPALLVPRFVHSLNAMASGLGMAVDVGTRDPEPREPWDKNRVRLVSIWTGTSKQLRDTGIFPKCYRFPLGKRGQFRFQSRFRRGYMVKAGRLWRIELDCGEIPTRIGHREGVEVINYDDTTAYYGSRDALIAAKVCLPKNLPTKRHNRSMSGEYGGQFRSWSTHRFLDGTYLFVIENEDMFKARVARENAVRLQRGQQSRSIEPVNPARMEAIKAAEADPYFQRFLGKLNLGQTPPAS